jgi:hypothetical protein
MPINFPAAPANGDIFFDSTSGNRYIYNSVKTQWKAAPNATTYIASTAIVSNTAPIGSLSGNLWWHSTYGRLLVYYNDGDTVQWVDATPATDFSPGFTIANLAFDKANSALQNTNVTIAGNLISTGSFTDSKGEVRTLPFNPKTATYTLTIGDSGKVVSTNSTISIPDAVFYAGNTVVVYNNSSANISITNTAAVTLYTVGTSNTINKTLQQRGVATILCVFANTFVITGGGLA